MTHLRDEAWEKDNRRTNRRLRDGDRVVLKYHTIADFDVPVPAGVSGIVVHARTVRVRRPGYFANVDVVVDGVTRRVRVPHNALRKRRDQDV